MFNADYRFLAIPAAERSGKHAPGGASHQVETTAMHVNSDIAVPGEAEFTATGRIAGARTGLASTAESPGDIGRVLLGCVDALHHVAEQISHLLGGVDALSGGGAAPGGQHRPSAPDRARAASVRAWRAVRPEPAERESERPGPGRTASGARVVFRTLGTFGVEVDGYPMEASRWRSKKSRDLIKLLLARPGRSIPREEVMNVLWPDEPAHVLGSRLSVVLSTTRSVLAGDRRCTGPSPLGADRDVVTLDLSLAESDVACFLDEADRALAAERRGQHALDDLIGAELRYHGDFLECEPYADWAVPLREHARARYINVLHALVRQADRARQPVVAIDYALRLLQCDAYDEQAHLGLFRLLRACGRHGEARRVYANYLARMSEIGVQPTAAMS